MMFGTTSLFLILLFCISCYALEELVPGTMVDLHVHSQASDGSEAAIDIVDQAAAAGIKLLVLTEHDQINIPQDAIDHGKDIGVEVLVGAEISCEWYFHESTHAKKHTAKDSTKAHMLAYFFNPTDRDLKKALDSIQQNREERNHKIINILNQKDGIQVTYDDVLAQESIGTYTTGRVHFARAMVEKGYVSSIEEAFTRYLNDDILNLPQWSLNCDKAVELINFAGGMSILAHPITLELTNEDLKDELLAFMDQNILSGIEAYSSRHDTIHMNDYKQIADELDLLVSGGSDFHGIYKLNVELGKYGGGSVEFEQDGYEYYNKMVAGLGHLAVLVSERKLADGFIILVSQLLSYMGLGAVFYFCKKEMDRLFAQKSPLTNTAKFVQSSIFLRWFCMESTSSDTPDNTAELKPLMKNDGSANDDDDDIEKNITQQQKSPTIEAPAKKFNFVKLIFVIVGLQSSYLTWGFFQERIMTVNYGDDDSNSRFTNSEFLVFINRFWALIFATIALRVQKITEKQHCPVFKYSFASMSNIMSSWFQYETLKYMSFPLMGLAKSTKVVVTMLMGKIVSGKEYPALQYFNACLISVGLIIFRMGGNGDSADVDTGSDAAQSASSNLIYFGFLMVVMYVFCDSFTSTWQSKLFTQYKMSSFRMMQGINLCSVFIGLFMLMAHDALFPSIAFMLKYPTCAIHALMMSMCSASGQMFIFATIAEFGPVLLATIMTFRQVISILLSMYIFGHPLNFLGVVGMGFVFFALFAKVYGSATAKKR